MSNNEFFEKPMYMYEYVYFYVRSWSPYVVSCLVHVMIMIMIFDFRGPIIIMGSLKSPCRTSYRSSMALNCFVFEKIAFFLHFGDRQANIRTARRTDGQHRCTNAALAVVSGGLIIAFKKRLDKEWGNRHWQTSVKFNSNFGKAGAWKVMAITY